MKNINLDSIESIESVAQNLAQKDSIKKPQIIPKNCVMLAPLAGYTDLPFRFIAKEFGADITVSEMISCHALAYNNKKTLSMVQKNSNEMPFSLQIAGSNLDIIKRAIDVINSINNNEIIVPNERYAASFEKCDEVLKLDSIESSFDICECLDSSLHSAPLRISEKTSLKIAKETSLNRFNLPQEISQKHIQILDLNCGCPAPKVAHHGNGSGLLKDLKKLVEILCFLKEHSAVPYLSVKTRLGFDRKIPREIAAALADTPIDFVVVHCRTKSDGYKKERIDYSALGEFCGSLRVSVIANGEIDSAQKVREILNTSGASGVMIGRAAIERPWIFAEISHNLPDCARLRHIVARRHFIKHLAFYGDFGVRIFRKNLHAYAKGLPNSHEFREIVNKVQEPKEMLDLLDEFFIKANDFEIQS